MNQPSFLPKKKQQSVAPQWGESDLSAHGSWCSKLCPLCRVRWTDSLRGSCCFPTRGHDHLDQNGQTSSGSRSTSAPCCRSDRWSNNLKKAEFHWGKMEKFKTESNINQLAFAKHNHQSPPTPQKQQKMTNSSKQVTTVVIRFFRIPQRPQDGIPTPTIRHAPQVRMLTRVAGTTGHRRPNHLRHPVQAPHDPYIVHPESSPQWNLQKPRHLRWEDDIAPQVAWS